MKILNPYRFYRGSGGKKNDKVPSLTPPRPQDLKKSISIAEIVDLLCEGPIYGLVDQFGKKFPTICATNLNKLSDSFKK